MEIDLSEKYYLKSEMLNRASEIKKRELKELNNKIAEDRSRYTSERKNFENIKLKLKKLAESENVPQLFDQTILIKNKMRDQSKMVTGLEAKIKSTQDTAIKLSRELENSEKNIELLQTIIAKNKSLIATRKDNTENELLIELKTIKEESLNLKDIDVENSCEYEDSSIKESISEVLFGNETGIYLSTENAPSDTLNDGHSNQHNQTEQDFSKDKNESPLQSESRQRDNSEFYQGIQEILNLKNDKEHTLKFKYKSTNGKVFELEFKLDNRGQIDLKIDALNKRDLWALKLAEVEIKKSILSAGLVLKKMESR